MLILNSLVRNVRLNGLVHLSHGFGPLFTEFVDNSDSEETLVTRRELAFLCGASNQSVFA